MPDFDRPASDKLTDDQPNIALPVLSPTQIAVAEASVKNFLAGMKIPPTQNVDREKIKAAIESFLAQIKNLKKKSAEKSKTIGKTGKGVGLASIAGQVANTIGKDVPEVAKFLPKGTNLSKTTFDQAINALSATVIKMQELQKIPSTAANFSAPAVQNAQSAIDKMGTAAQAAAAAYALAAKQAQIKPQVTTGAPTDLSLLSNRPVNMK